MFKDSIVEEVHRIRTEHAEAFGHNLHAMCESLRAAQATSNHKVVSRLPRRPVGAARSLYVAESRSEWGKENN